MALKMKRSAVAGKVPTTVQLELGELAVNTYDGRLFLKRDDGSEAIVEIVNASRQITAGKGLTGGGALSADRTLEIDIASISQAEEGFHNGKVMTPLRVAQAIAAQGGGVEELTAGTTIRSRRDAYYQRANTWDGWYTRHAFDFFQGGTIRVAFERAADGDEDGQFRVTRLRNGTTTELNSWTANGTTMVATTLDVDVKPGDRVSVDMRSQAISGGKLDPTTYGFARIQNVRFQTGGGDLIPGVYAPVENG